MASGRVSGRRLMEVCAKSRGGQEGVTAVSLGSSSSQHQKLLQYFREQNKGSV